MKQEFYFHIPQPCHEDWDKMTTAAKGRFCESCSKNVVDFSLMTDNEVLNYFKNNSGKVCGRFANDQLQRPFIPLREQKKKTWWVAMMMPLLLLFDKANAQKKNTIPTNTLPGITVSATRQAIVGKTIIAAELSIAVTGKICNEKGEGIPFATVSVSGTDSHVSTDSIGKFQLRMGRLKNTIINASSIGYESNEIAINDSNFNDLAIILKAKEILLPEIIVRTKDEYYKGVSGIAGAIVSYCRIKKVDTVKTSIRKIFKTGFFKTYPNPAQRGSVVHLEIKKAGDYSIQLFDNNSNLILVQAFSAANDNSITNISIPSSLAAGIYYLRLIDEKKKKQFTDKIIVE